MGGETMNKQTPGTMAITIDKYLTLSVSDLKRLGYLKPRALRVGGVSWKQWATVTASISVTTDTRALPMCYLRYRYDGEPIQENIRLMFKHSNLNPEGEHGYYYFVCPVTGECCRKLYNVGGRFVGRSAFKALYPIQAASRKQRKTLSWFSALERLDELQQSRYRKDFYRGKPTRYRLRWERIIERNAQNNPLFSQLQAFLLTEQ